MHISWNFLDKRKATIEAIESYDDMAFIIDHGEEEIAELKSKMLGVGSPGMDGLPHAHDPKAGEERLVNALDEIDVLKERYRQAVEYMEWFRPAWGKLSEDEQFCLKTFYKDEGGSSQAIQDEMNLSQSGAYNKKNRALNHLTKLLYGKV